MLSEETFKFREASLQEDSLIAEHFYQMWLDNDVPDRSIQTNWLEITLQFIENARLELSYKAFVAEVNGKIIGSASCQLFAGLYPLILTDEYRKYGYIWGVYVEPTYRRKGVAKKTHPSRTRLSKIPRLHPRHFTRLSTWKTSLFQPWFLTK